MPSFVIHHAGLGYDTVHRTTSAGTRLLAVVMTTKPDSTVVGNGRGREGERRGREREGRKGGRGGREEGAREGEEEGERGEGREGAREEGRRKRGRGEACKEREMRQFLDFNERERAVKAD